MLYYGTVYNITSICDNAPWSLYHYINIIIKHREKNQAELRSVIVEDVEVFLKNWRYKNICDG